MSDEWGWLRSACRSYERDRKRELREQLVSPLPGALVVLMLVFVTALAIARIAATLEGRP